jgi:hypothetical protein
MFILDDNTYLYEWDRDSRLQRCVGMSRLIHPTTVGFRYAARVRHGSSLDSLKIAPAQIRGISVDVSLSPAYERDWLTVEEARLGLVFLAPNAIWISSANFFDTELQFLAMFANR